MKKLPLVVAPLLALSLLALQSSTFADKQKAAVADQKKT